MGRQREKRGIPKEGKDWGRGKRGRCRIIKKWKKDKGRIWRKKWKEKKGGREGNLIG
jgi:hypothetical protein